MRHVHLNWCVALVAALCFTMAGCSPKTDAVRKPGKTGDHAAGHAHEHPEHGPNGGALVEWGDEEYHPEFTVDHDAKQVIVFLLDGSAKKAPRVDPTKITDVKVSITNVTPPITVDLQYDGGKSGEKGIAFVGTHEAFAKKMEFKGNVSGNVDGKPYSGEFEEKGHGESHDK